MDSQRLLKVWGPIALLAILLGGAYAATLAPGLTWAHSGADGGDFIAAAATGGVPHPSGYPTYLLLARAFQFLPFGTLAYRTNLASALCALGAALWVNLLVARLPGLPKRTAWIGGLAAALAFGLSPALWSQAIITEVYALQAFFLALILLLLLEDRERSKRSQLGWDGLLGLVCGLAVGNHLTTLFILPLVGLIGIVARPAAGAPGWRIAWNRLGARLAGLVLGLLVYVELPLRARLNPPINWGDPQTLANFLWLVSGKLYAGRLFAIPGQELLPRLQSWANQLIDQFGWVGLGFGVYGLFFGYRRSLNKLFPALGLIFVVFSVFSIGYNSYDSDVYLVFAFMAVAILIGIGAAVGLDQLFQRKAWLGGLGGGMLALGLLIPAVLHYPAMDVSQDRAAEDFGREVFEAAPREALLFTDGDESSFTLWYFHYALHQRPDVTILVKGLLPYPWYRNTLRQIDPTINLPADPGADWEGTLQAANSNRPSCEVGYDTSPTIVCR